MYSPSSSLYKPQPSTKAVIPWYFLKTGTFSNSWAMDIWKWWPGTASWTVRTGISYFGRDSGLYKFA